MKCPYCKSNVVCMDSKNIYIQRSYGMAWVCSKYPECDAYVGCHDGTKNPLGRLANGTLRSLKGKVHALFDPLWKEARTHRGKTRRRCYKWLAGKMEIDVTKCHVGMFDESLCERAIAILKKEIHNHGNGHEVRED